MVELSERELNEARTLNQQYQLVLAQKQALSMRVAELEGVLKELENAKGRVYYGAGSVLIESDKKTVTEKLKKQKKETEDSVETISAREESIRKKLEDFQKKVQKEPEKK